MDQSARTAFIQARTAMMLVELEGMKAENTERERNGLALAYNDHAFTDLAKRYCDLEYNNLISYLRGE